MGLLLLLPHAQCPSLLLSMHTCHQKPSPSLTCYRGNSLITKLVKAFVSNVESLGEQWERLTNSRTVEQISTLRRSAWLQRSLSVRTPALNPGQPLLLPFTYFLILGVCGWQKSEQHGHVTLLYSVWSPRPGTHKTQNPSGMDNSTHLKKIQYSPQAVQDGRSVSLRGGGEKSMITREHPGLLLPVCGVCRGPPASWNLSCLSSCHCACSPAHQIPLNPSSEVSSPAWAFPDAPTSRLLVFCASTALKSLTLYGPQHLSSRFLTSRDPVGLRLPSTAHPTGTPGQDSLFVADTLP